MEIINSKIYPSEITERVKMALRTELGGNYHNNELDDQIKEMTKLEIMDKYFAAFFGKINSFEISKFVKTLFNIELDRIPILSKDLEEDKSTIPLSRVLIDSQLDQYSKGITGAEIRQIINQVFGVNLDAIASLEGARISLYSKKQWIIRNHLDLFEVHTGVGDVNVKIIPTKYFIEKTGLEELPFDLQHSLSSIGYSYDEKTGTFNYSNPTGKAVPEDFKGRTIATILKVIYNSYPHL